MTHLCRFIGALALAAVLFSQSAAAMKVLGSPPLVWVGEKSAAGMAPGKKYHVISVASRRFVPTPSTTQTPPAIPPSLPTISTPPASAQPQPTPAPITSPPVILFADDF